MCNQSTASQGPASTDEHQASETGGNGSQESFPWHAGVHDAHCHPTDTMASIASIPGMRASVLTIMATRSQDQDLVASVASEHGLWGRTTLRPPGLEQSSSAPSGKVVPAFGWHPWFTHELYDDTDPTAGPTYDPSKSASGDQKLRHYAAVLSPAPEDTDFVKSLPEPRPLSAFIAQTRQRLQEHPHALVGEIGLDKGFRLPEAWPAAETAAGGGGGGPRDEGLTPGGREGRLLSPFHVRMPHQVAVLRAQLRLAGELDRAVSLHGVQAHGVLHDALAATWRGHEREVVSRRERDMVAQGAEDFWSSDEDDDEDRDDAPGELGRPGGTSGRKKEAAGAPKPYPPRVCLHSFSGAVPVLRQYLHPAIPARVFFSFSTAVNLSTATGRTRFDEVVRACPDGQILVESDLHVAGDEMDAALEDMYRRICEIKGWTLEQGVEKIGRNYEEFIFG